MSTDYIREVGRFLVDRLEEFERELIEDEVATQFFGHVAPALARFRDALDTQVGRQRISLVDQHLNEVGRTYKSMSDLLTEEVFMDEHGTVWTAPTAWAYYALCRVHNAQGDRSPKGGDGEAGSVHESAGPAKQDAPK